MEFIFRRFSLLSHHLPTVSYGYCVLECQESDTIEKDITTIGGYYYAPLLNKLGSEYILKYIKYMLKREKWNKHRKL